jgi:hypothetical protein
MELTNVHNSLAQAVLHVRFMLKKNEYFCIIKILKKSHGYCYHQTPQTVGY